MAENLVTTEPCEAEGVCDDDCDTLDFQCFEDEIRELICPKVNLVYCSLDINCVFS